MLFFRKKRNDLLHQIEYADNDLLDQIIPRLIRRFCALNDGQELVVISLPKDDPQQRELILDSLKKIGFPISTHHP